MNICSVDINISSSYGIPGLAHELTHGAQYDRGQTDLKVDGSGRGYLHDLTDEASAFRRQYAIAGSLGSAASVFDITTSFVRGLNPQYYTMPGSSLNTSSTVLGIFVTHRAVNPAITYNPDAAIGLKLYSDAKTGLFSGFISR